MTRAGARVAALALALSLGAAGCTRSDTTPSEREDAGAPPAGPPRRASVHRGLYAAVAPDSGTIVLCEGPTLPVRDRTGGELRRAHDALGGGPGGRVFVELRAESVAAAPGAAAHFAVVELVRASPVGESAGCEEPPAPYRFRASGNEPFWSATVGKDSVVFEQPEEPRRTALPLTERTEEAGRRIFAAAATGASRHEIRVTLTRGRCSDSMSGALYSLSAEVVFDGRPLSGCARGGDLGESP